MSDGDLGNELSGRASAEVLVVDDESSVRELVVRWLTAEGHTCAQAASVQTAWQYLQAHEIQLVTLDIRMAGRSGIDLLRHISETYPDTSVIMMTGVEETQTAIEAFTRGAYAYLTKPVQREELCVHVRSALERRRLILEKREYMHRLEQRVREQTVAIRAAHEETIYRLLSASQWRDEETGMHCRRVGLLSELLAKAAGWSAADAEDLRLAAPMHDIGKIGIPDAVLCKPGKLFLEEFDVMKQHTVIGAQMLAGSEAPMLQMAQAIALNHHERWDGGGYPAGLAGYAIPESARIVTIVDVYDAMTHDRVYRPAMPEEDALAIMQKSAGRQFDPLLLAVFFSQLDEIGRIARENPDETAGTAFGGGISFHPRRANNRPGHPCLGQS